MTLTMVLMIYVLKRGQLKALNVKSFFNSVCRITFVSTVMGFLLLLLLNMSNHVLVQLPLYYQFMQVSMLILIGASTYLVVSRWLKSDELVMLTTAFRKL